VACLRFDLVEGGAATLDFGDDVRVGGGAGLAVGLDDQDPIAVGRASEILDASICFSFDTMLLDQI